MDHVSLGGKLPPGHRELADLIARDGDGDGARLGGEDHRRKLDLLALVEALGEVLHRVHDSDSDERCRGVVEVIVPGVPAVAVALAGRRMSRGEVYRERTQHFVAAALFEAPRQLAQARMLLEHGRLPNLPAVAKIINTFGVQFPFLDELSERAVRDGPAVHRPHHRESAQRSFDPPGRNAGRRHRRSDQQQGQRVHRNLG